MLRKLLEHRLVKDTLVLLGVQLTGYVLPLITLPYLTRVLGPANFGLMALGTAMTLYFAVIIDYGFAVTGTRQVAIAQHDPEKISQIYSTIMACKLGLLAPCFLALLGAVAAIPQMRAYWPLYLISFLQALGFCLSPNWFLQGVQRMRFLAYSDYTAKIIGVLLIFVLVRRSSDYLVAAAIQSGSYVLSAVTGLFLCFSVLRLRVVWPTWTGMRAAMLEGWPVFLSMGSMTIMTSSNTMILGMVTPPEQVGFLSASSRVIIAARGLSNPVAMAVYPHMSRLAVNSPAEGLKFLRRQLLWTTVPFLAISLGLFAFAPLLVSVLYGPRFAEVAVLLRLMSPVPVVHAVSVCFSTYYILAYGYERVWSKIITRMVILNFVLLAVLMLFVRPLRAVAVTTTLTDVYSAVAAILFFRRTADARAEHKPSPVS